MISVVGHHDASHQARQVCLRLVQLPMPIEKPQTPTMSTCNGFPVGFPIQTHHSFENTRCLNTQPVFSIFEKAGNHDFAMRLGKMIDFFFIRQNHKIKTIPQGQGPRPFPIFDVSALVFRTGPCVCASLLCVMFGVQYCCSTATVLM